ncbi:tetratricopeptide repeat domain 27 [Pelomyxa schiedti]|nr:tetratricopeptide repeat domain 27 [Pelomyxa schiedti]
MQHQQGTTGAAADGERSPVVEDSARGGAEAVEMGLAAGLWTHQDHAITLALPTQPQQQEQEQEGADLFARCGCSTCREGPGGAEEAATRTTRVNLVEWVVRVFGDVRGRRGRGVSDEEEEGEGVWSGRGGGCGCGAIGVVRGAMESNPVGFWREIPGIVERLRGELAEDGEGVGEGVGGDGGGGQWVGGSCTAHGRQLLLLISAIGLLWNFVQANWTGPEEDWHHCHLSEAELTELQCARDSLSISGECLRPQVRLPHYLAACRAILSDPDLFTHCTTYSLWLARCSSVHQQVLSGIADIPRNSCLENYLAAEKIFVPRRIVPKVAATATATATATTSTVSTQSTSTQEQSMPRQAEISPKPSSQMPSTIPALCAYNTPSRVAASLACIVALENCRACTYYRQRRNARTHLRRTQRNVGVVAELVGAMGKRTKFQEKDTPLLTLQVDFSSATSHSGPSTPYSVSWKMPEEKRLEDESPLLEHIQYSDHIDATLLTPLEQAYLLSIANLQLVCLPNDELRSEEVVPYVSRVVRDPADWSVQFMALLLKSRLDKTSPKTIQRSVDQLTELINEWERTDTQTVSCKPASAWRRLGMVFTVPIPCIWELKRELGLRLMDIGAAQHALRLFEELQMWEEVIQCYISMNDKTHAQQVTASKLQQLEREGKGKSREVWNLQCILGDLGNDPAMWEKAWADSKGVCARAKRSLGMWCFAQKRWVECVSHLREALAVNPVHARCWFIMGCAAMNCEGAGGITWRDASSAFSRCAAIDPEDGDAWCNLASACVKGGKLMEAHMALGEGVKVKEGDWRVWQNRMIVALRVRDCAVAIRAMKKVIELNPKLPVDVEVLGLLSRVVINGLEESSSSSATTSKSSSSTNDASSDEDEPEPTAASASQNQHQRSYGNALEFLFEDLVSAVTQSSGCGPDAHEILTLHYMCQSKWGPAQLHALAELRLREGTWDTDDTPTRWSKVATVLTRLASCALEHRKAKGGIEEENVTATAEEGEMTSSGGGLSGSVGTRVARGKLLGCLRRARLRFPATTCPSTVSVEKALLSIS